MRRVRHLNHCDYIVNLRRKNSQLVALSNCNTLLKRSWHKSEDDFKLNIHAKFNATAMNGVQICAELLNNDRTVSSVITEFKVYRVSELDWSETLVANVIATETDHGFYTGYISQATLGSNELSGMEVYKIVVTASRVRNTYTSFVYFNHLGCFDSINRLRQYSDQINILKLDE